MRTTLEGRGSISLGGGGVGVLSFRRGGSLGVPIVIFVRGFSREETSLTSTRSKVKKSRADVWGHRNHIRVVRVLV